MKGPWGTPGAVPPRQDGRRGRLRIIPSPGPANSLWYWERIVPRGKAVRNFLLMWLARRSWSMETKARLYRRMGAKVGSRVSVGLEATLDIFWPELITIGDDTIIGYDATILCHEFLQRECRVGPVVIGRSVVVGANATILPGVVVADGSVIGAGAVVTRDVAGFVAGVPARPVARGDGNGTGVGDDGDPAH